MFDLGMTCHIKYAGSLAERSLGWMIAVLLMLTGPGTSLSMWPGAWCECLLMCSEVFWSFVLLGLWQEEAEGQCKWSLPLF